MRLVKLLLELGAVYILLGKRQGTNKRPLLTEDCRPPWFMGCLLWRGRKSDAISLLNTSPPHNDIVALITTMKEINMAYSYACADCGGLKGAQSGHPAF